MDSRIVDQLEEAQADEGEEIVDPMQDQTTEEEVEEPSPEPESSQGSDVPDKFQGKSLEDVVEMYQNLEKEYGRKGNEVGELRKLTDELLQLEIQQKRNNTERVAAKEEEVLSDDDWFSSPKEATDKYLQKSSLAQEVKELKDKLSSKDREEAHKAFVEKHPDYTELVNEQGFKDFVQGSKYRMNLAEQADQFDYEAANELFELYKAVRPTEGAGTESDEAEKADKKEARKKATLEGTGNRNKGTKKVYRRADLIKMKMNDPERYMNMQDEIMQAYAEGRVK